MEDSEDQYFEMGHAAGHCLASLMSACRAPATAVHAHQACRYPNTGHTSSHQAVRNGSPGLPTTYPMHNL